MRIPTFFLFLIFISQSVISQNFSLSHGGTNVSNSEITVNGTSSTEYIKVVINITNSSTAPINLKVRRNVRENIAGSFNLFCLGNCYDPSVDESPVHFTVGAGVTTGNDDFYVQFFPEGNTGTAKIKYDVFNASNPAEVVSVTINYVITATGIGTFSSNATLTVTGFVNQQGTLRIGYSLPTVRNSKIFITNILGNNVAQVELKEPNGIVELPVGPIPKGIYICSILSNGRRVVSRKFVIN